MSSKKGKSHISRCLVECIRNLNPPGRFLKKKSGSGVWEDVGDDVAREKTSQALRDAVSALGSGGNADAPDDVVDGSPSLPYFPTPSNQSHVASTASHHDMEHEELTLPSSPPTISSSHKPTLDPIAMPRFPRQRAISAPPMSYSAPHNAIGTTYHHPQTYAEDHRRSTSSGAIAPSSNMMYQHQHHHLENHQLMANANANDIFTSQRAGTPHKPSQPSQHMNISTSISNPSNLNASFSAVVSPDSIQPWVLPHAKVHVSTPVSPDYPARAPWGRTSVHLHVDAKQSQVHSAAPQSAPSSTAVRSTNTLGSVQYSPIRENSYHGASSQMFTQHSPQDNRSSSYHPSSSSVATTGPQGSKLNARNASSTSIALSAMEGTGRHEHHFNLPSALPAASAATTQPLSPQRLQHGSHYHLSHAYSNTYAHRDYHTHPTNAHSAPPLHNRARPNSEMQVDLGELEDFDLFNGELLDSDLSPMVNQLSSDDTDRDDKYSQFKNDMSPYDG